MLTGKTPEKRKAKMLLLKKIAAILPTRCQIELRRLYLARQIIRETFVTDEPEYKILGSLINPGDWVIDVGANVGHYTKRFSELVGPRGRVIAFEPVPTTFSLLSANVLLFPYPNVTLINAAVSHASDVVGMVLPKFITGLTNYYKAQVSTPSDPDNTLSVLTLSLDSLDINQRVALVKIDVEGHESLVLAGMQALLKKYHPILIVETDSKQTVENLTSLGYLSEKLKDSPNILFKPNV